MRLDTACIVAPKPKVPSMPTRRAFLLAGGLFATGMSIGSACGYAVGAGREGDADAELTAALRPTGDADLDELRRLAVVAPMTELADKWQYFVNALRATYSADPILWHGAERLAVAMRDGLPALQGKPRQWFIQVLDGMNPDTLPPRAKQTYAHLKDLKRRK